MKNIYISILLLISTGIYSLDLVKIVDNNNKFISRDYSFDVNGNREYTLISKPKVDKPVSGYPVLIIIHGHIPIDYYSTINSYKTVFNNYARSEFIVVKPDLRAHDRSDKGENYNPYITQVYFIEDIITLVEELKKDPDVDTENIFVMGHSNGGSTTLRLLVEKTNLFKAALLWAPVTVNMEEHNYFYKDGGKRNFGLEALKNPKSALKIEETRQVVEQALKVEGLTIEDVRFLNKLDKIETPVLIKHADTDESVPYYWSEELVDKFKKSGNNGYFELINYPGDNHNLSKNWPELFTEDLNWFRSFID